MAEVGSNERKTVENPGGIPGEDPKGPSQNPGHSPAKNSTKRSGLGAKLLLGGISVLFCLVNLEVAVRFLLGNRVEWETRPFEPFFVSGDYYGALSLDRLAHTREGPRASGYKNIGGLYLHERPKGSWDANSRADFLFDHYLSRYSAKEADRLNNLPKRPLRIYIIGGSLAVGSSATTKEKTWHALLEGKLRKSLGREDLYVINAAMGAFVSSQERMTMEWAVAPREPDMVIVLNGYNDIHTPISVGVAPGDPLQTGMRYAEAYDTSFTRWFCQQSALARLWWKARMERRLRDYRERVLADKDESEILKTGIVDVYTGNMKWLTKRGKQMGAQVSVFFQPWKSQGGGEIPNSEKLLATFAESTATKIVEAMKQTESFHDLTGLQPELLGHYTDAVHLDDAGQEILAEAILKQILPKVPTQIPTKSR